MGSKFPTPPHPPKPYAVAQRMSTEQMVREILVAIQKDCELVKMLARGDDPQTFTASDVLFPANRLSELLRGR